MKMVEKKNTMVTGRRGVWGDEIAAKSCMIACMRGKVVPEGFSVVQKHARSAGSGGGTGW